MDSSIILDDILRFTKDELLAESERRGMAVPHEKTKMEVAARILEDNSRQTLEQSTIAAKEEVSTTDLLRIVHQMLTQPKYSGKLISTPDLSHTLPTFAGRDEDTLKEWLSALEAMRLQYEWEDATVLAIAQNKLRSAAKDWNEGAGRKIKSWEEWKVELTKQFGYEVTVLTWSDRCKARVQGEEENIADYMHSKMKMIERCPVQLRERDKVDYLVVGVRQKSVASGLLAHFKATKGDCYSLIELARDLEPRVRGKGQEKYLKGTDEYRTQTEDKKFVDAAGSATKGDSYRRAIRCFRCQELGHFGRDHDDPFKAKKLPPVTKYPPVKRENNYSDRDGQRGSKTVCALLYKEEFRSKHPTRPVLSIRTNDHIVDALLDSGADMTVVRSDEARDLGLLVKPWNKPNVNVVGADSHPKGVAKVMIEIGKRSAVVEAAVVDQTPYPVLVGSDWKTATNTGIMAGPGRRIIIEEGEKEHKEEAVFLSLFLLKEGDSGGVKTTECGRTDLYEVHESVGRSIQPEIKRHEGRYDVKESKLPTAIISNDESLLTNKPTTCEDAREQEQMINSVGERYTKKKRLTSHQKCTSPFWNALPYIGLLLIVLGFTFLDCQLTNRRTSKPVVLFTPQCVSDEPFRTMSMYHFGSLPESERGMKYFIDLLRGQVESYGTPFTLVSESSGFRSQSVQEEKKRDDEQRLESSSEVLCLMVLLDGPPFHVFDIRRQPKLYRVKKILPNEIFELEAVDGSEDRGPIQLNCGNSSKEEIVRTDFTRSEGTITVRLTAKESELEEIARTGKVRFRTKSGREIRKPSWQSAFLTEVKDDSYYF